MVVLISQVRLHNLAFTGLAWLTDHIFLLKIAMSCPRLGDAKRGTPQGMRSGQEHNTKRRMHCVMETAVRP